MSSVAAPPTTPRPSVFLSYASEDRAAARALRDTLAATGLEVWYDENELGGGDAWDQKIRRQIRDCDYFMPMISAATEARKEGYFRREWRLAAERTLDMADDVMFLLPVSIDGTSESGARVPDKFLSVQWLRLPGGLATPALDALCRRLLAGEHTAPPRPVATFTRPRAMTNPPLITPSAAQPPPAPSAPPPHHAPAPHHDAIPAPPFPHVPEKGGILHGIKFLAEVLWWSATAAWMFIKRAPRWIRVLLSIWFVFFLFSRCGSDSSDRPATPKKSTRAATAEMKEALKKAASNPDPNPELAATNFNKLGAEVARNIATALEGKTGAAAGKQLVIVAFDQGIADATAARFANDVFSAAYGRLLAARPADIAMTTEHPATATDSALVEHGKKLGAPFILAAHLTEATPRELAVRLLRTADGAVAWQSTFPVEPATTASVASQVSESTLAALPQK